MNTDREILEMSAKAIGYEFYFRGLYKELPAVLTRDGELKYWMPLEKSEHAFELSVKLKLHITHSTEDSQYPSHVNVSSPWHGSERCKNRFVSIIEHEYDADAATRRAICIVAAEIGRSMK